MWPRHVDPGSDVFKRNHERMTALLRELRERTALVQQGGGEKYLERQRQQAWLFFGESLGHGACAIVGPAPLVRYFVAPYQRLVVALRQGCECAAGPEGIPDIPNGPFHAAFLISRSYLARTWREVIVSCQFQQPRVEMNLVATAFQHHALQIVVVMCPTSLCGGDGVSRVFEGGPRACGHIMRYSELSHSSRVLSSFQAMRARDAAEIPEPTSQVRSASVLARSVGALPSS